MDGIRKTQHRPTVALVLSGGGAKGAAEVGVLKYLEEVGIPVDFICGTSIGGLVGGLYALGYSADEMKTLFLTQDWDNALTDRVAPEYIPFATKMRNYTYIVTLPFHYGNSSSSNGYDNEKYSASFKKTKYGKAIGTGTNDEEELHTQAGINSLASSLPSGYAYGFNVNNIFSSLSVGYQDSLSFASLPIPFMCVSSDMVTCKAKNWGSGSVKTAMRSTMSIPGLFNPVRTDGMVLVDGGTRNNFPTDIARAAGADYIIGIELSDVKPVYEDVNNIGNILSRFIAMLGMDSYEKNIQKPDVFIKPYLKEYNMLSFNPQAIDTMLTRGYNAAKLKSDEIMAIKSKVGDASRELNAKKATDIGLTKVQISSIEFDGITDMESNMLFKIVSFKAGDMVGRDDINKVMSRLQATGAFESITYSLYGEDSPYRLVFNCSKAPHNTFGLGFRLDSEEWASMLFDIGLNTNSLMGSQFNFTAKLGQNMKAEAHYALALPWLPTINLSASIARYKGSLGDTGQDIRYDVSYWKHKEQLYFTDINWIRFNFQVGVRNQFSFLDPNSYLGTQMKAAGLSEDYYETDCIGAFAKGNYYTFDNLYYPSKGVSTAFHADYDFVLSKDNETWPICSLGTDIKWVIPAGSKFAIIPDIHIRSVINNHDSNGESSMLHTNLIGGSLASRYSDYQVPFFGINDVLYTDDNLLSTVMEMRYNPVGKLYFSALAGFMDCDPDFFGMFSNFGFDHYAFGLEGGYNFPVGPIKLNAHWSNATKWGVYFSFGFDF